jgi:hypothetical protein
VSFDDPAFVDSRYAMSSPAFFGVLMNYDDIAADIEGIFNPRRVQPFLVVDFFQEVADGGASMGQIAIFVAS